MTGSSFSVIQETVGSFACSRPHHCRQKRLSDAFKTKIGSPLWLGMWMRKEHFKMENNFMLTTDEPPPSLPFPDNTHWLTYRVKPPCERTTAYETKILASEPRACCSSLCNGCPSGLEEENKANRQLEKTRWTQQNRKKNWLVFSKTFAVKNYMISKLFEIQNQMKIDTFLIKKTQFKKRGLIRKVLFRWKPEN